MSSFRQDKTDGKLKDGKCPGFEPQTWRKTLCKNCFKTRSEHDSSGNTANSGKVSQDSNGGSTAARDKSAPGSGKADPGDKSVSENPPPPSAVSDKRQTSQTNSPVTRKTDTKNGQVSKSKTTTSGTSSTLTNSTSSTPKSVAKNSASTPSSSVKSSNKDVNSAAGKSDNNSRDKNTNGGATSSSKVAKNSGDDVQKGKTENETLRKTSRTKISASEPAASKEKHSKEKSASSPLSSDTSGGDNTASPRGSTVTAAASTPQTKTGKVNSISKTAEPKGTAQNTAARTARLTSSTPVKTQGPQQQQQPLRKSTTAVKTTNGNVEKLDPVTAQAPTSASQTEPDPQQILSTTSTSETRTPAATIPDVPTGGSSAHASEQEAFQALDDLSDDTFATQGSLRGLVFERSVDAAPVKKKMAADPDSSYTMDISREEAMLEGTRMLMDNLREKNMNLEEKCEKLEREKKALSELLSVKKREMITAIDDLTSEINNLEERRCRIENENRRLLDRLQLPESERYSIQCESSEISDLQKCYEESETLCVQLNNENSTLRHELAELKLEMDELYDQFREDEALEFRELQRELENTSKNCRILQFKLRKAERRYEQSETDRAIYEERVRQAQNRNESLGNTEHMRELEEEMKMAKDVSVRLHDELEVIEERRSKLEEEAEMLRSALRHSESKRTLAENEAERLIIELDKWRNESIEANRMNSAHPALTIPRKHPALTMSSRESSLEHDVTQLLQNLEDAKERENDLREQLKFAEEENKTRRKKLSDLEEENESLSLQLQKLSTAKSGKFLKRSASCPPDDKRVITETEHELRLQLDLAENEIKVLRRKMNEMEQGNENLAKEVKFLQETLASKERGGVHKLTSLSSGKTTTDQPTNIDEYKVKVTCMGEAIDELKWKLIEKDREVDKLTKQMEARAVNRRAGLQRSRSLDSDYTVDMKRQLDLVLQEAGVLKLKITELELENERLVSENKKLQLISHRKVPVIQTDDAAVQNIELKDKLRQLERENAVLRDRIISIDERTNTLSREVTKAKSRGIPLENSTQSHELREQLHLVEQECTVLRRKMAELETENSKLTRELRKYKGNESQTTKDKVGNKEASIGDLRERIVELEDEIGDMLLIIKSRDQTTSDLEEDIETYKDQIDHMVSEFRKRESHLCDEIQCMDQKNSVLSNLLDIVTERAESVQRELERVQCGGDGSSRSDRSPSVTSAISDTSTGSDDVFLQPPSSGKSDAQKDWEDLFKKRIESLEVLLAEERHKTHALEKKMQMSRQDSAPSSTLLDTTMYEREKALLQQELAVCQQQLADANSQLVDLKHSLELLHTDRDNTKKELDKIKDEVPNEKSRSKISDTSKSTSKVSELASKAGTKSTVDAKTGGAAWRWEKQDLEKQIKEYKKKYDDLYKQTLRNPKVKSGVDENGDGSKDKLDKEIKNMKEECKKHMMRISELEKKLKQLEGSNIAIEKKSSTELERKDDIIKQKDSIIQQQKDTMTQKDAIFREKEESMLAKEKDLNHHKDRVKLLNNSLQQKENDLSKISELLKHRESLISERDSNIKILNDKIRQRDDRLKEKDDILEKMNSKILEKESESNGLSTQIKSAKQQLTERERQLNTMKAEISDRENKQASLEKKLEDRENKTRATEKELKCAKDDLQQWKGKLEKSISELRKEKENISEDLKKTKDGIKKKEDRWKKEKSKLELELKQLKEQVHSMELSKTMRQGDLIRTINKEKQTLIDEKHALNDQIKALKSSADKNSKSWNTEREDMKKVIQEKQKTVDDNRGIHDKLQGQISKLKQEIEEQSKLASTKQDKQQASICSDGKMWENEKSALLKRLETETLILKSEKDAAVKKQEARVKLLNEEVRSLQSELERVRSDFTTQREHLENTQRKMTDLKTKYDIESSSFREERFTLERRAKEGDDKSKLVAELQRTLDDLKFKNRDLERTRTELLNKMAMDKSSCDIEKSTLQTKVNKLEEQLSTSTSTKLRSSKVNQSWEKERAEQKRLLTESHNLALDLQQQLKASEKSRENERVALEAQLDQQKRKKSDDLITSKKKDDELREKSIQMTTIQKAMIDLQDKIKRDRESWQMERTELRRRLDDYKRSHANDKERMEELLIELDKLKTLAPMLTDYDSQPQTLRSTTTIRLSPTKRSSQTSPRRSVSPRRPLRNVSTSVNGAQEAASSPIDEALQQISKVTDNMSQRVDMKSPPVLRRCYSSNETEQKQQQLPSGMDSSLEEREFIAATQAQPEEMSDPGRRSRTLAKRSFSFTPSEFQIPVSHIATVPPARSSRYASGTRSAATSRDPSPDKYGVRRLTNYPMPTRGFLISPSHTPRKHVNAADSSQTDVLTSSNVSKLVEKLSRVDSSSGSEEFSSPPSSNTRQGSMRKLNKSVSVDSTPLDQNLWVKIPVEHVQHGVRSAEVGGNFSFSSSPYLPYGGQSSGKSPGGDSDSSTLYPPPQPSPSSAGSASSARMKFYEDYNSLVLPSSGFPPQRRYSSGALSPAHKIQQNISSPTKDTPPKKTLAHIEIRGGKVTVSDKSEISVSPSSLSPSTLSSPTSPITTNPSITKLSSSKEKRSLFGSKKSASVDNPSVMSSIARIGVQGALPPAVRTSVDIPDVAHHTGTVASTLKKLFKRSSSVEGGAISPTTTLSMSSSTVYRDSSESSISSKLSRQFSATSVTSSRPGDAQTDGSLADLQQVPSLTPKFLKPRSPANRRRPKRWQSMEKASERPIIIPSTDEQTDKSTNVLIVRQEIFTPIKVWHFSETAV